MLCIAIDDEPIALDIIRNHASRIPFLQLSETFVDALEALDYLQKYKTDLIFLDVNMPDISGLALARSMQQRPLIIFTTAYSEYAVESYEVNAVDYLLKPFDFVRFLKAVTKAQEQYTVRQRMSPETVSRPVKDYVFVKSGYQQYKLLFQEILYIEGAGNYMTFITSTKKILSRMSLKEVVEILPPEQFIRVHKSYLVAVRHIERIEDNHIIIGKIRIPISAAFRENIDKEVNNG